MQRHEACHILNVTCDHCIERLEAVLSVSQLPREMRRLLLACVDDLHDSASRFADVDEEHEHDDCFVPIFDALGYCTAALKLLGQFGVRAHMLAAVRVEAQNALDELEAARSCAIPF